MLDQLAAQAIHIQRPLADPVAQGAPQDRRAGRVDAAGGRFAVFPHQFGATFGAGSGQGQWGGTGWAQLGQHPHHLGDDFAGLAHHDRVAGVQVELGEAVGVVEGGPAHRGAGQGHWFEFSHGGDHPGAPHLAAQAQQPAGAFFGGVFQRNGPAGRLLGESSVGLQTQVVELHHHPIGRVGQQASTAVPLGKEGLHGGQVGAERCIGIHPEACGLQPLQGLPLAGGARWIGGLPVVGEVQGVGKEIKPPGRHHLGVELAQGAGAGVAGVGKKGVAALAPLGVDRRKGAVGDQGFTPHLHPGRRLLELQPQGHRGDRAHVGGDLLTALAVAAGGGPYQHAVFVAEG